MSVEPLQYLFAFLVGGGICGVGQLVLDLSKYSPGHVLSGLVVIGGVLGGLGWYEPLLKFAGGGAAVPITSFGNALVKGAIAEAEKRGALGILTGMFELTSSGITAAIIAAFLVAVIFNPKA